MICEGLEFPFDPIERAKDIESIVMQGTKRSYYRVRFAERFDCPVTVDSVGCWMQSQTGNMIASEIWP